MPYAMFVESGAYNVYAVAETRGLRTLTGGVDVVPQATSRLAVARARDVRMLMEGLLQRGG